MAIDQLTTCKTCSKEVAKSASTCPHCGAKLKMGVFGKVLILLGVFFVMSVIYVFLIMPVNFRSTSNSSTSTPYATKENQSPQANNLQSNLPLPTSAKQSADNQVTIPFPYTDQLPNGDIEQWVLDRDTANNLVLKVLYKSKEVVTVPLMGVGINKAPRKITLDSKEYSIISITLNSDSKSGYITLMQ